MGCGGSSQTSSDGRDDILSFVTTGNALPFLHEIKHALSQLLQTGKTTIIDLGAIPFAPGDERVLDEVLGTGEVEATLSIMGESVVRETGIPGVWRVDHFDEKGDYQSRFIEITFLPDILKTQPEDAERGLDDLKARLEERGPLPADTGTGTDT